MASATLVALSPPASTSCVLRASCAAALQSEVLPTPLTGPSKSTRRYLGCRSGFSPTPPPLTTGITANPIGTLNVCRSPTSVCSTSGRNSDHTSSSWLCVGCNITATRGILRGTPCTSCVANTAVTCRLDGANTKPTASAPAATAASTASRVVRPQILTQIVTLLVVHRSAGDAHLASANGHRALASGGKHFAEQLAGITRVHQRRTDERDFVTDIDDSLHVFERADAAFGYRSEVRRQLARQLAEP